MKKMYLMTLSKEANNGISMVLISARKFEYRNPHYSFDFVYDTDYNVPFEERMKKAENSGITLCGIIGDEEFNNDGITLKNLVNGKQVFSKYENILEKVNEILPQSNLQEQS